MKNKTSFILVLCLMLSMLPILGQEQGEKPVLNDHTFVPISFMTSPFINSRLTLPIGVGATNNFSFNLPPELDTLVGLKGEVLFANLGIRYSQKVQEWINFYLKLGLTARIGTNFESILSQGFNTVVNFEVGSLIKLYKTDKIMLSMSVEVQNYQANFVDINGFVKDIVNGVDNPKLVRDVPALTMGGGLHFAWGISQVLGVRAESTYSYGETFTRGSSGSLYSIQAGIDADFNDRYRVPLGLAVTYTLTTEPEIVYVDDRTGRMFFAKIAYTGRKDFDFGIEGGLMVLPFENVSDKPEISVVNLTMSYFFN